MITHRAFGHCIKLARANRFLKGGIYRLLALLGEPHSKLLKVGFGQRLNRPLDLRYRAHDAILAKSRASVIHSALLLLSCVPDQICTSAQVSGFLASKFNCLLEIVTAKCEPSLREAIPNERYQFERLGYFALDSDATAQHQVWNRVVTLGDTWAKVAKR